MSAPAFGSRWWAETGSGSWARSRDEQPRRMHVSGVGELADASLSFQSIGQWRDAGRIEAMLALAERVWRDRAYGDMWSYMLLAEGLVDIVGEFDVKPYDLAALVPIVREAGGTFTDITGEPTIYGGSSLATNGLLHEATLEVIRAAR